MDKFCYSCGAPLDIPGFQGPVENYCHYCTDEEGQLKPREQVLAAIARWLQSWQPDLDETQARVRADRYLTAMPAWAD